MAIQNNVYIFNAWAENLTSFNINGALSTVGDGGIPGSSTAASTLFTPGANSSGYPRDLDRLSGSPQFYVGTSNTISFFTASTGSNSATITIPGASSGISLEDPLIIYITQNKVLVMRSNGFVTGTFDVQNG